MDVEPLSRHFLVSLLPLHEELPERREVQVAGGTAGQLSGNTDLSIQSVSIAAGGISAERLTIAMGAAALVLDDIL